VHENSPRRQTEAQQLSRTGPALRPMAPPDPHSFADPAQARTQSVALDLTVDFATHTIHGTALLKLDRQVSGREERENGGFRYGSAV